MSNSISRRTFLKCTGASVAALGAASLLGGCQQNGSATIVDVKVGDKVSNWNGLGVQLTSLFNIDTAPAQAGYEYIAVLVTVVNRCLLYTSGRQRKGLHPDNFLFTNPARIVTIKSNPSAVRCVLLPGSVRPAALHPQTFSRLWHSAGPRRYVFCRRFFL